MGETFCSNCVLYAYSTRLERAFTEKHNVLLIKLWGKVSRREVSQKIFYPEMCLHCYTFTPFRGFHYTTCRTM